ncbi:MAG: YggT family protein [Alphaproteobacteria bacterium]|nr:MAG: YggT family protein [Alphaproteobacteria bacterium]
MRSLLQLFDTIISVYIFIIFAQVILSWLLNFGVVNIRNQFVKMVAQSLYQMTEPVYRPIRNFLPNLGSIDISPLILFLLLTFGRSLLWEYWPQ